MIVSNRKLFKKRPARDNLNQAAGIMASSPELMGEVQGFDNGGNVQLPGSVGSIVQMLDTINELPEIVVKGIKSKFSPKTPVNPIQEVPVIMPNGEPGFAIYENGELKGYTSSPSSKPMIKDRSRQVDEIASEVRPPVNVSSTSISNLLRGLVGADKGKSEAVQEFEEAKKRGELGIQDSRLLEMLGGRGGYAEKGLTGILRLVPELQEFVGDLSGSASGLLGQQTDETKLESVGSTLPGVNYRSGDFPVGIPTDTPFKVLDREGFRGQEAKILEELGPAIDMEDPNKNEIQAMLERIQKGQEDTEKMKGPVAPTTSLSSRVEKVKAERDAIEAKEQQDFERAILAGQAREKFFDPLSVEKFLEQRPIATEIGGEDPRVDLPPGAFPKADKQVEELNNIVSENKKDDETFDAMGDLDIEAKRAIVNQTNNIVETTTGSNLDQLMKEFIGKAPEYKGANKGLTIAKIGFAIAAGKSADGIQNIADGLSMGADMLLKDEKEKDAFNRQIRLAGLQYGLGELSKERAENRLIDRENRKQNYFVADKDIVHPETGQKIEAGGLVALTTGYINKNGLPNGVTTTELAKEIISTEAAIKKLIQKQKQENILDVDKAVILQEKVNQSIVDFTSANTLKEIVEGNTIRNAEGSITGIQPAFMDLVNKIAVAGGIELDPDKYENVAKYNSGMRRVSNLLLKDLLGEGSKNVSNIDRKLADEIVGLYRTYITTDPDILNDKLQNILGTLEKKEQGALTVLNTSLEGIAGRTTASGKPIDLGIPQEIISRMEGNSVVPSTTWGMKDGIYRKLK